MEVARQDLLTITNGRGADVVLNTVGEVAKGLTLLGYAKSCYGLGYANQITL